MNKNILLATILIALSISNKLLSQDIVNIGSNRELFLDDYLLDTVIDLDLKLHAVQEVESTNIPNGYYQTIIKTDSIYRIYYRANLSFWKGPGYDGNPGEITKSAISKDGYNWQVESTNLNDSIVDYIYYEPPFSHNFTPFKDLNPNSKHRYKALAGTKPSGGLFSFYSDDGVKFEKNNNKPIIKNDSLYNEFDSQNIAFWSENENQYVCYFRRSINGLRSFARTTSKDFVTWTQPLNIFPNLKGEHLYASGIQPYFRAPHMYIALSTRFFPKHGSSTDIVLMNSRDGVKFNRTFKEAYIRPGLKKEKWGNRSNYITLNVVPLDDTYMGIFARNSLYKIRIDGFSSINAKSKEGYFITKPFKLTGDELEMNYSTSAGGFITIEILDTNKNPIQKFSKDATDKIIGDGIYRIVTWGKSADLSSLKDKTIRLRIVMKEADLYSLKFNKMNK